MAAVTSCDVMCKRSILVHHPRTQGLAVAPSMRENSLGTRLLVHMNQKKIARSLRYYIDWRRTYSRNVSINAIYICEKLLSKIVYIKFKPNNFSQIIYKLNKYNEIECHNRPLQISSLTRSFPWDTNICIILYTLKFHSMCHTHSTFYLRHLLAIAMHRYVL